MAETAVEQVAIEIDGVSHILSVASSTGLILSLSSRRRGPEGNFGQFLQEFSDYRITGDLMLPFKVTATFNGQPWKEQSPTIEAITINGKLEPALFEKPGTGKTP